MSLKDLEENLYKREEGSQNAKQKGYLGRELPGTDKSGAFAPAFFNTQREDKRAVWIKEDDEKKEKIKKIKKIALIVAGTLAVLSLFVWGFLILKKKAFSESKVTVSVSGSEKVESGDPVTLGIEFKNDNWADLKDAVLLIKYSENFRPEANLNLEPDGPNASRFNIGTLKGGTSGHLDITGKFFGTKDFLTYVDARLEYSSSNFSSRFQTDNKLAVMITSSPLAVEISAPQAVYSGGAVTYEIKYRNTGEKKFQDLRIKADYPEGFSFTGSEPLPVSEKNIWYAGDLAGGQSGTIKIFGTTTGAMNEIQRIKAYIGIAAAGNDLAIFNEAESSTKIIGSPLLVKQKVNEADGTVLVNAGESLNFVISFKNTGSVPLRDVILTENIKSSILNYSKYSPGGDVKGNLDSKNGKITWTGSQLEALRVLSPGAEGQISFSIPVLEKIPVQKVSDKNFSFQSVASMDSPDIPTPEGVNKQIASNSLDIKLNSKLLMTLKGYYSDPDIQNFSPLPLKVGQETTFTMHLDVGNVTNDITNAKILITLSPGAVWKNNFLPKNESISYNDRTNELIWDIGSMPAGIGILTGPKSLAFQIGIVPAQTQIGDYAPLLKKAVFTADDVFTKQKLTVSVEEKNSNLTEDISLGEGGKVGP